MTQNEKIKKSTRTKQAILEAAQKLFAKKGFKKVSVREIAQQASVDPALVIRYFGNKEKLFNQVAHFDLALPDLQKMSQRKVGETLVRHFLEVWENSTQAHGLSMLLRSAASDDEAANKLKKLFSSQVTPKLSKIGNPRNAQHRAGLIASQLLGLAMLRYIFQFPPLVKASKEELIESMKKNIEYYVFLDE